MSSNVMSNNALVVISGSMGSGKTTVLAEASDLLTAARIAHAAIDLDTLGVFHSLNRIDGLEYQNLTSVWLNYANAGIRRLLLAAAVESAAELQRIVSAVAAETVTICRLTASLPTMQQRVAQRDPGIQRDALVARAATLDETLARARLEDFAIDNDASDVTDVARELLSRAGWLAIGSGTS